MKKKLLFLLFILPIVTSYGQIQKGLDIDGETAGDFSGCSVSMPDANTVAIGALYNSNVTGHVRIYSWNGTNWVQKGNDIDGEAMNDQSGHSVSMPDANTVAIGAPYNNGNGASSGHVRIYKWNGTNWVQKGSDIDGEAASDWSGYSVSMPDTNTVAIGAPFNNGNGTSSGHVRIYKWNGTNWFQKGSDINGEAPGDRSGHSVFMPDTNTIAIGATYNSSTAGHVRIYKWNGSAWIQKGTDIDGEASGDISGQSVSMPDSNTVAIGAPYNAGNGNQAGHVRIYKWNGTNWFQKGNDIDGEVAVDRSGWSVSMPDTSTVAIGAYYNGGNGSAAGHVRIYNWSGTAWIQKGNDIDGEAIDDQSGKAVYMPDANTVAIGAIGNDGNGLEAGHVRVYDLNNTTDIISTISNNDYNIVLYPNPTTNHLTIHFNEPSNFTIHSIDGKVLQSINKKQKMHSIDCSNYPSGVYYIKAGNQIKNFIKE